MRNVHAALVLLCLSGCGLVGLGECSGQASCISKIEWRQAIYYEYGGRGAVISPEDTEPMADLGGLAPAEAADSTLLALEGVSEAQAVVMRAAPGTEVADGITVDYLIYVRDGEFPESLCRYYVSDPPGDPAPPALPEACD